MTDPRLNPEPHDAKRDEPRSPPQTIPPSEAEPLVTDQTLAARLPIVPVLADVPTSADGGAPSPAADPSDAHQPTLPPAPVDPSPPPTRFQRFVAFARGLLGIDTPSAEVPHPAAEDREHLRLYFPLGQRPGQKPDGAPATPLHSAVRVDHRRVNPFLALDFSELSICELRCQLRAEGRAVDFPPHPLPPLLAAPPAQFPLPPISVGATRPVSDALLRADLTLDGMPLAWQERDVELLEKRRQQPYMVDLQNLHLKIAEGVFPPEFGASSQMLEEALRDLVSETKRPGIRCALDMGTGSGYLAIALAKAGVPEVWAIDLHSPAVACAEENVRANGAESSVRVMRSDLFSDLPPGRKFDLIVFNQPYYPTPNEIFGPAKDGGQEIIRRFLRSSKSRLYPGGIILMPFSPQIAGTEHNPAAYCQELGFCARVLSFHIDARGRHLIWAIQRDSRRRRLPAPSESTTSPLP